MNLKIRNRLLLLFTLVIILFSFGCSNTDEDENFKVGMVTDVGGVNDMSFNQSAWEGMKSLEKKTKAIVKYLESSQVTEYASNIDRFSDQNYDLIFGVGNTMYGAVEMAARTNPELKYAIVDNSCEDTDLTNITGIVFRSQEAAFLVGYIAALKTETNKLGFIGGVSMDIIDQFHYGYIAGIEYVRKQTGKKIDVVIQYADTFTDSAKGKAIASKMFSDGCDIVFHAAGGAGIGIIESAKECGKFAIGVDSDQGYLAPDNVLTSALKIVGNAVQNVAIRVMMNEQLGGHTLSFGIKEECVGIPKEHKNYSDEIYNKAMIVREKIVGGEIYPPFNKTSYDQYIKKLHR